MAFIRVSEVLRKKKQKTTAKLNQEGSVQRFPGNVDKNNGSNAAKGGEKKKENQNRIF